MIMTSICPFQLYNDLCLKDEQLYKSSRSEMNMDETFCHVGILPSASAKAENSEVNKLAEVPVQYVHELESESCQ